MGTEKAVNPEAGRSPSNPEPARLSPPTDDRTADRVGELPPGPFAGGPGCLGCPFGDALPGKLGGGTVPPPVRPPLPIALLTEVIALDAPPAPLVPAAFATLAAPPAIAAPAPVAKELTAAAPATTPVAVATGSPPERAGDPPRTAAKSLGICQQSIMKISAAPITSNPVMLGLGEVPIPAASLSQPPERLMPTPISM